MNEFVRMKGVWDDICPFQITSIIDDRDGLVLSIEDNRTGEQKGRFRFTAHRAYRNFNEADLHGYWLELGGVKQAGLYVAEKSDLLNWAEERCGYDKLPSEIRHYMVVSAEDVLEVLSFEPPEFDVV